MTLSTHQIVQAIRGEAQDFEWYPTTDEMLQVVRQDMRSTMHIRDEDDINCSVLDVGAGNGNPLMTLTKGARYAIEKSQILINQMDKDIIVVGTDFYENNLIDKKVSVIFSNPPYSDYAQWVERTICEGNAKFAYFVIPQRWKTNEGILNAIKKRKATAEVIWSGDFLDGDRKARAVVDIVKVQFCYEYYRSAHAANVDPFDLWFKENFKLELAKEADYSSVKKETVKEKIEKSHALIEDKGMVNTLVELYDHEMSALMGNYLKFSELDPELLDELNVSVNGIKEALKLKIKSLKDKYWKELFDNLNTITDRLTSDSRASMLKTMMEHTTIDFTRSNAHSIVIWAIKNANTFIDKQLMDIMQKMVAQANVTDYKSNEKTFLKEQWEYRNTKYDLTRYKLEHRCIIDMYNAISSSYSARNGLANDCMNFIADLITLAGNVGLDISSTEHPSEYTWRSGKKNTFHFTNHVTGKTETLMEVKAFLKGNIHVKFLPELMLRLNVENGRLNGWVKSAREAAEEMDYPLEKVNVVYKSNLQLAASNVPLLAA